MYRAGGFTCVGTGHAVPLNGRVTLCGRTLPAVYPHQAHVTCRRCLVLGAKRALVLP